MLYITSRIECACFELHSLCPFGRAVLEHQAQIIFAMCGIQRRELIQNSSAIARLQLVPSMQYNDLLVFCSLHGNSNSKLALQHSPQVNCRNLEAISEREPATSFAQISLFLSIQRNNELLNQRRISFSRYRSRRRHISLGHDRNVQNKLAFWFVMID